LSPREPEKLPAHGHGPPTILQPAAEQNKEAELACTRVELPLIRGDGKRIINPTNEELDASLWGNYFSQRAAGLGDGFPRFQPSHIAVARALD